MAKPAGRAGPRPDRTFIAHVTALLPAIDYASTIGRHAAARTASVCGIERSDYGQTPAEEKQQENAPQCLLPYLSVCVCSSPLTMPTRQRGSRPNSQVVVSYGSGR